MRTRAERRHNSKRIKNKFRSKVEAMRYINDPPEWTDWYVNHNYNNRQPCSCHMCGNPRKLWKDKTIQEKKSDEQLREWRKSDLVSLIN